MLVAMERETSRSPVDGVDTRPRQISFPDPDRHLVLIVVFLLFLFFAFSRRFWDFTIQFFILTDLSIYSGLAQRRWILRRSI